jgi:hypothetical protein
LPVFGLWGIAQQRLQMSGSTYLTQHAAEGKTLVVEYRLCPAPAAGRRNQMRKLFLVAFFSAVSSNRADERYVCWLWDHRGDYIRFRLAKKFTTSRHASTGTFHMRLPVGPHDSPGTYTTMHDIALCEQVLKPHRRP